MDGRADNRRTFRRVPLEVAARIENKNGDASGYLCSRDVSTEGAFFKTGQPYKAGDAVKVEFYLAARGSVQPIEGSDCYMRASGTVVRREPGGIGVRFSDHEARPAESLKCINHYFWNRLWETITPQHDEDHHPPAEKR